MKSPNVAINLVPIGAGGGLQNALSYLIQLSEDEQWRGQCVVFCRRGSAVEEMCIKANLKHEAFQGNIKGRIAFEFGQAWTAARRNRCSLIFTLFGNPPVMHGNLYCISGMAFSNILCPEIPFWSFEPIHRRWLRWAKDIGRKWSLLQADEIIVETEYLRRRALQGVYRNKKVHCVKMRPSELVLRGLSKQDTNTGKEGSMRLLFLGGAHPNKRVHLLAPIIAQLATLCEGIGIKAPVLTATISPDSPYSKVIQSAFDDYRVSHLLNLIGGVSQETVPSLLLKHDAVVNLARFESFSNNWVEAWSASRLLIATDADWARESCGNGAVYVDPDEIKESAEKIFESMTNSEVRDAIIYEGTAQLQGLLRLGKKFEDYARVIDDARNQHS
jgi:hypothetical protein